MLWLLLLPFRLLFTVVFGLLALPFLIVLLPFALLLWIPFVLLKLTLRVALGVVLLPVMAVLMIAGLFVAGAAAAALFVPIGLCLVAAAALWGVFRPARPTAF
jgi:hypothetical protein